MSTEAVIKEKTSYFEELEAIRAELDKCMKCGNCMAVCPVYGAEKLETSVTRSKITIAEAVLDGQLELDDPQVYDMLFNCLVCKSCMSNCPTQVNFECIMLALRAALVRKNGLPWLKKMIFSTLKNPKLFDAGMRIGAAMQPLAFRDEQGGRAMAPRSPFALVGKGMGMDGERLLPSTTTKPLRERMPEVVTVKDAAMKVAFFTGDSLNYFYPDAGEDLISVLSANKIEVHIPKEQSCCGTPVLVHGDVATVRSLARKNIDAMDKSGCEYIITGCGSCGNAWQHDFPELMATDPVYGPRAQYWAERTYDISTFLTKVITMRPPKGQVEQVVTYHDPCHLKKGMKVSSEPREILKSIPGLTFKEMKAPDACCGSGGSFVLTHYETSASIGRKKADDISQTGANTVSTGCPACMMQLMDNMHRCGQDKDIVHYISLLAESYRRENKTDGKN